MNAQTRVPRKRHLVVVNVSRDKLLTSSAYRNYLLYHVNSSSAPAPHESRRSEKSQVRLSVQVLSGRMGASESAIQREDGSFCNSIIMTGQNYTSQE